MTFNFIRIINLLIEIYLFYYLMVSDKFGTAWKNYYKSTQFSLDDSNDYIDLLKIKQVVSTKNEKVFGKNVFFYELRLTKKKK